MELDLIFETPQETVHRVGAWVFRLYEQRGRYALPDVFLQTERGMRAQVEFHGAAISEVRVGARDSGQLESSLRGAWRAPSTVSQWIAVRHEVIAGVAIPVGRLVDVFRGTGRQSVEAQVSWRYSYTRTDRTTVSHHVTVALEFMAPGLEMPVQPPEQFFDPIALKLGVPAVLRDAEGRADFSGFAAIDFGTSSSTVTVYDARHHVDMAIDPGQATRLRLGLADLLRGGPFDAPAAAGAWQRLTGGVADEVAAYDQELAGIDAASLDSRLRVPSALADGRDLLLDAVCAAVENVMQRSDGALRDWLAPRLLQIYDKAFNVPPLEEMFLRQVVFDQMTGGREISSTVTLQNANPVAIVLGPGDVTTDPANTVRALKTKLQRPTRLPGRFGRDGREATTDDLIAQVYLALMEHAEAFAHANRAGDPEIIRSLVVTYPTTTPPSIRERLRRLVQHPLQVDTVVTDFDEGVAAGLFFLLRDFGSNRREFGVEGLRARSRRVADDPPAWRQNMLVLDMGAGTTDIVLISLTLTDMTRPIPGCPPHVQGRYYVIRPEVRNSTGHPQLGGDYLTLKVFYWLKAAIVDALLDGPGHDRERAELRKQVLLDTANSGGTRQRLVAAVLEGSSDEPASDAVREKLRAVLPTDWKGRPEVRPEVFEQLWSLAEEIKIALGGPEAVPYTVSREELAAILLTGDQTKALVDLLPASGITLASADLLRLARPVLVQAVQLASWLIRNTLKEGEPLDRLMLAGRSSMMPLMRQVVLEELTAESEKSQGRLNWNPLAVTVEAEYAKQAASIGACWAQSFRNRAVGLEDASQDLAKGRTQIMIDVDNLTHTLPCAFRLQGQGADDLELLSAGLHLTEIDDAGTVGLRSKWVGLRADFQVNRPLNQSMSIQWGVFHYKRRAVEDGFEPDPAIWQLSADAVESGKVRAQLEVTQTLVPYLQLCQGKPQYLIPGSAVSLRDHFGEEAWVAATENRLTRVPAALWVRGQATREHPNGEELELFPAWEPGPDDDITAYFGEFFRDSDDPHLEPRPGRISAPLPRPRENGEYRFFLRWPDGRDDTPVHVERRGQRGPTARFVATLDARGQLAIHRGSPAYWGASSLEGVQKYPGAVYRVRMDAGVPYLKDSWDPFNGSH